MRLRRNLTRYSWQSADVSLSGRLHFPKLIVSWSLEPSATLRYGQPRLIVAGDTLRLQSGDHLVMDGLAEDEFQPHTDAGLERERANLTFLWATPHFSGCLSLVPLLASGLLSCAQGFAGSDSPGRRTSFCWRAFGLVSADEPVSSQQRLGESVQGHDQTVSSQFFLVCHAESLVFWYGTAGRLCLEEFFASCFGIGISQILLWAL